MFRLPTKTDLIKILIRYAWIPEAIQTRLRNLEPSEYFEGVPLFHSWMWFEFGWPSVIVEDQFGRKHLRFIRRFKHCRPYVANLCTWSGGRGWDVWDFKLIGSGRVLNEDNVCWEYAFNCNDEYLDQDSPRDAWRNSNWDEYTRGAESRIFGYNTQYTEGEVWSVASWKLVKSHERPGCWYPAKIHDVSEKLFIDFSRPIYDNPDHIPKDATHMVRKRNIFLCNVPYDLEKKERKYAPIKI